MGEALSSPENQENLDGQTKDALVLGDGAAGSTPNEGVLLSQLIQLLSQRQRRTLLLSDLGALLPGPLRQRVKDQGGLRSWLQRYQSLFLVSGQPGKESVTLVLGSSPTGEAPAEDAGEDARAANALASAGSTIDAEDTDGDSAVQLRGLPYRATKEDVRTFLGEFASKLMSDDAIHLVLNRDGRPSGFARVQFNSPEAAKQCQDELHLRSMEDRYVEVFLYSERPSRGRQRRGSHEDGVPLGGETSSVRGGATAAEAPAISREQVVKECRAEMAEPKCRRLLLSMLGVALSPGARAYLKQMDQGLKHFLAQFPGEFSVEGGKGCEYVTYTPTISLSEAVGPSPSASAPSRCGGTGPEPSSPKPTKTPPPEPTPSGGRGLATPSDWGTPSAAVPTGSGAWLPPWPAVTGLAASGDGNANPWSTPASWPVPPAQYWGGWPPAMYPWGASAPMEAGSQPTPGNSAAAPSLSGAAETRSLAVGHVNDGAQVSQLQLSRSVPETLNCAGAGLTMAATVRLRGLPFTASEQDVLAFFAQHDIVDRIADGPKAVNLMQRSNGRPSGQAVVQMRDPSDAELAQRVLHGQWMGSRYIEVFLYEDPADPRGSSTATQGVPAVSANSNSAPGPVAAGLPPWVSMPSMPWPGMPAGAQAGVVPEATETSWEALFEFLGPEASSVHGSAGIEFGFFGAPEK